MLEVKQLTRHYDNLVAVDNVNFSIGKGEIVGLLGHNGAGKTTIMKMLSGFLEPDSGSIYIDGIDFEEKLKTVQTRIGYLPENLPVYSEMIVADYLDYVAELKNLKQAYKYQEIKRVINATDIADKLLSPIATLSRGYKQRVGVAQAILGHPGLLILDEPTNGLDPEQTQQIRELIRDIAKDATVILSTHIMQEVDALCSRVLIIRNGKLAVDEKLDELRDTNRLIVESSMPYDRLSIVTECEGVNGIDRLETKNADEFYSYRVELKGKTIKQQISAAIAQKIIDNGYQLFLIQPEHRDLETLFREVSESSFIEEGRNNVA